MTTLETPVSFACGLVEALPQPACLYLSGSDLVFPNTLWREQVCEMSRLADLADLGIDAAALAQHIRMAVLDEESASFSVPLDAAGMKRLLVSEVRGVHEGLFLFLLRDDTELRRVEQMRKDFIANVSHELRTPLTAVRGYVETLMDPGYLTIERVQQFMPVIFEHTERLHNLMLDLLSLSRLESPDTRIEVSALSLDEEIQGALEATAPLAAMKGIAIEARADGGLRVMANSEHLERVLVNLLDNAIKYSPPSGRVTIWTERDNARVWTHVVDEGPGISSEELPRVFERFYRTKGAVSGRVRGSGLGLAIVKHIVQQLGGEIRVSSCIGEGSDFFFCLPLAE